MIKKVNRYLLTHYPLIWNTRIIWLLLVALLIHLVFFFSGYESISLHTLSNWYSLRSMVSFNVYTFSIFTSIIICLVWLIYFLRNNAYKDFYLLGRWHNTRQFLLILLGFLSISTFFESYYAGVRTKIKSITSKAAFVNEVNSINEAMAFIPLEKNDYFKLNDCSNLTGRFYHENLSVYTDSLDPQYKTTLGDSVRRALSEKDAFSYTHYCQDFINVSISPDIDSKVILKQKKDDWLVNKNKEAIEKSLEQLLVILRKYKIDNSLPVKKLAALPFKDSLHTIQQIISQSASTISVYPDNTETNEIASDYINVYDLRRTMSNIEEVYSEGLLSYPNMTFYIIEAYFVLYFSLLLLCYKLYRRKVFLYTIIGGIILTIVLGLLSIPRPEKTLPFMEIFLCCLFLVLGTFSLQLKKMKTLTGAWFNWHILFIPLVVLFFCAILNERYEHLHYYNGNYSLYGQLSDQMMQQQYPFLYWVHENFRLIAGLNILLVILYTIFVFIPLSKKWHLMPEE